MTTAKLPRRRTARPGEIPSTEEVAQLPVKYLDPDAVCRIYTITRGRLWPILKCHPELSITLVDPGRSRGKRLINVAKLEAFLALKAEEQKHAFTVGEGKKEVVVRPLENRDATEDQSGGAQEVQEVAAADTPGAKIASTRAAANPKEDRRHARVRST
jgi:hypothetical protein